MSAQNRHVLTFSIQDLTNLRLLEMVKLCTTFKTDNYKPFNSARGIVVLNDW